MSFSGKKIVWTKHAQKKIRYYSLPKTKLKRMLYEFDRKEQGIAPNTIAVMKRVKKTRETEIWLMYEEIENEIKIVSAWRYPGTTEKDESIYIPSDVFEELNNRE